MAQKKTISQQLFIDLVFSHKRFHSVCPAHGEIKVRLFLCQVCFFFHNLKITDKISHGINVCHLENTQIHNLAVCHLLCEEVRVYLHNLDPLKSVGNENGPSYCLTNTTKL